jgi:hypothetical protein
MRALSHPAIALAGLACIAAASVPKNGPDCSGPEHYPASVAFGAMKNERLLTNYNVLWKQVRSRTIASQQIGKNLWRQVFKVTYPLTTGRSVQAVVVEEVSTDECSMSEPQIYLISKAL